MATNFPSSLDAFTNPTADDSLNSSSVPHADQHANVNDAVEALQAKVGADSSAVTTSHDYIITSHEYALTQPTGLTLKAPLESWSISATAATGTINVDIATSSVWYYTSDASANWTFNFRGDGSTTLDSLLAVGESVTTVFFITNGTTAYYPTTFTVDSSSVTPKWSGGSAPSAGNVSSIDAYLFTLAKTAAATFTVLGQQVQFA